MHAPTAAEIATLLIHTAGSCAGARRAAVEAKHDASDDVIYPKSPEAQQEAVARRDFYVAVIQCVDAAAA